MLCFGYLDVFWGLIKSARWVVYGQSYDVIRKPCKQKLEGRRVTLNRRIWKTVEAPERTFTGLLSAEFSRLDDKYEHFLPTFGRRKHSCWGLITVANPQTHHTLCCRFS